MDEVYENLCFDGHIVTVARNESSEAGGRRKDGALDTHLFRALGMTMNVMQNEEEGEKGYKPR